MWLRYTVKAWRWKVGLFVDVCDETRKKCLALKRRILVVSQLLHLNRAMYYEHQCGGNVVMGYFFSLLCVIRPLIDDPRKLFTSVYLIVL